MIREPNDVSLRVGEADSIRAFVQDSAHQFWGRTLDLGAGKQPYRTIVESAGGQYVPYDRMANPASVATTDVGPEFPLYTPESWDAILCTQVIQYVPHPNILLDQIYEALKFGGALVLTYPTTWPIIEPQDLWRFTPAGIERLLREFQIVKHEPRGQFDVGGFKLQLGGGIVAVK